MDDAPQQRPQFTLWQLLAIVTLIAAALAVGLPLVRWMAALKDPAILLPSIVVVVVVVPGLVIGLGMTPLRSNCIKTATIAEALSHGIGLLGIVVLIYGVVPSLARVFREFDVELPTLSKIVVATSEVAMRYTELATPLVVMLVLVDVVVFALLHATVALRSWAKVWSASITLLLLTTMIVSFVELLWPLTVVY